MSTALAGDARSLENGLKELWARVRRAAELIARLREEKRTLEAKVGEMENELHRLQQEISRRDQLIVKMKAEAGGTKQSTAIADGDREAFVARVKELLVKLDAYL
jgi:chromosome segregation ATPase